MDQSRRHEAQLSLADLMVCDAAPKGNFAAHGRVMIPSLDESFGNIALIAHRLKSAVRVHVVEPPLALPRLVKKRPAEVTHVPEEENNEERRVSRLVRRLHRLPFVNGAVDSSSSSSSSSRGAGQQACATIAATQHAKDANHPAIVAVHTSTEGHAAVLYFRRNDERILCFCDTCRQKRTSDRLAGFFQPTQYLAHMGLEEPRRSTGWRYVLRINDTSESVSTWHMRDAADGEEAPSPTMMSVTARPVKKRRVEVTAAAPAPLPPPPREQDISPGLAGTNSGKCRCENCGTDSTPTWRRCRKTSKVLCNACGIYQNTNNRPRPCRRHFPAPETTATATDATRRGKVPTPPLPPAPCALVEVPPLNMYTKSLVALEGNGAPVAMDAATSGNNNSGGSGTPLCEVCGHGGSCPGNRIVSCDRCGIHVHQACYGVQDLSSAAWLCHACSHDERVAQAAGPSDAAAQPPKVCAICLLSGGPMAQLDLGTQAARQLATHLNKALDEAPAQMRSVALRTAAAGAQLVAARDDSFSGNTTDAGSKERADEWTPVHPKDANLSHREWVHTTCALWTQRIRTDNPLTMSHFGLPRFNKFAISALKCVYCQRAVGVGVPIQCSHKKCAVAYHPRCALMKSKGLLRCDMGKEGTLTFSSTCEKHRTWTPAQLRRGTRLARGKNGWGVRGTAQTYDGGVAADEDAGEPGRRQVPELPSMLLQHEVPVSDEVAQPPCARALSTTALLVHKHTHASWRPNQQEMEPSTRTCGRVARMIGVGVRATKSVESEALQPAVGACLGASAFNLRAGPPPLPAALAQTTTAAAAAAAPGLTTFESVLQASRASRVRTYVGASGIAGLGLYASTPFAMGEIVAEYTGELIRNTVADVRERRMEERRDHILATHVAAHAAMRNGETCTTHVSASSSFVCFGPCCRYPSWLASSSTPAGDASMNFGSRILRSMHMSWPVGAGCAPSKDSVMAASALHHQDGGGCESTYLFRINDDLVVDAMHLGNAARFINHSCDPSCGARIEHGCKIVVYALRSISVDEEITYDYQLNEEPGPEKMACYCGSSNCRKWLN
ncbi:histone-lysine N-methyltransferase [Pycnococcus provasolii]